ncbi:hypothetical protein PPO43_00025 [Saprospira sp. CCB-QB6]|uniref:hypothetical protein n=1 Tax=Saprospira sp. CCB-QB6 TaxID=3023936 RepID=UPI00234BBE8D|nr:hypothetical protein [Saprospira sp. CCB-QB6]WCL81481.1 hypothetical protein PPO43_00025 [Saprospira sp. CCB-QB6]
MNRTIVFLLSFCFFFSSQGVMAQKKLEKQRDAALVAGQYQLAKVSTQQLIQRAKKPKSKHYYALAQAHFGLNEFDSCLQALQVYLQDKNHQDQALFLAARAFHYESNYLEAMHYYKLFLKTAGSQKVNRRTVKRLLLQAVFAERNAVAQSPAIISPYERPINSPYEEGPLFQGNGQNYYFSSNRPDSNGQQNGQIYQIEQKGRGWGQAQVLGGRYNSPQNELLLGFSAQKDQIFFQRDSQGLVDNFQDTYGQSLAVPIALDSQYHSWTGDHYFFNDSLLFFAAGPHAQDLDIYYRKKNKVGDWSAPIALAFPLNTAAPERSPFLAADGKTLFFSRLSAQGIGDYDVYQSVYEVEKGQWSQPELLPAPISSPGQDLFFRLSANGLGGQLLSQRAGGFGGLDIYQLYFRQERRAQLAVSASLDFLRAEEQQPQINNSEIPSLSVLDSNSAETNITLSPLYYSAETGAWQDQRQLDRLLRLLQDYPNLNLLIEAHSDAQYEASRGLFLSVQQAQQLAQELLDKGIAAQRIYLRGCGLAYPQAQNFSFDGSPNPAGQQFNRRIELRLLQTQKTALGVHYNWPKLSSILLAPQAKNFRAESQGLRYRLAIQTSTQLFDDPILGQLQDVAAEKQPESPEITYYLGHARNFKAANALRETLEEGGFKAIRIQAYLDGWPLQKEQIPFLLNQYPDLKAYLTE